MPQTAVRTGVTLNYEISGEGEPAAAHHGDVGVDPAVGRADRRGWPRSTGSSRSTTAGSAAASGARAQISVASLAEDASALLEALEIPRAHTMGWSLGSAVLQELALAHPEQVASAIMYATWARCDGFQRAVLAALRHPCVTGDMESALGAAGLAFSPQLLDNPEVEAMMEAMLPAFPQTEDQMQVTVEQWDADLVHDTLDRLGGITAPTLVIVGEQDLLTPPWQAKDVADAIPGARFELLTGPGPATGCTSSAPRTWSASSPASCTTTPWSAGRPR